MAFVDTLSALRESAAAIDGADMSPYDSLSNDYTAMESGAQAKISQLEEAVMALTQENSMLKAHNYDLMMTSSAGVGEPEGDPADEEASEDEEDEDVDIATLAKNSKDDE